MQGKRNEDPHTALSQNPQDVSVSVVAKFNPFFSPLVFIYKMQNIMLPKSSDLSSALWDWNLADKISHNKQTSSYYARFL